MGAHAAVTAVTQSMAMGNRAMEMLRFPEAERCFREALRQDPKSAGALAGLARLALIGNKLDEGRQLLDRALLLHPACAEVLALKGVYFMQREDFHQAVDVLEKAKAADPALNMIYFNLGKSYRALRQFAKAEQALRRAIELNPKYVEALYQLGLAQIQTRRVDDGIRSIEKAIEINPLYLKGYLVLGSLAEKAGKAQRAIRLYQDGLRHNPHALPLRERLCSQYASMRDIRSAWEEAIEIVKRRRINVPRDYLRLGTFAAALGQYATAQRAFQKSIELNPVSWEGHCNLAKLYARANLIHDARRHYEFAVQNNPGEYVPFNEMGLFLLLAERDCDGSIPLFQKAAQLAPARPEPQFNLALAHARKCDYVNADKFVASALKLAHGDDRIVRAATRLQTDIQSQQMAARIQRHRFLN